MHSALRLEVAVGIVALELDGGALDAGLIPFHKLGHGHLVAVALAPAHVHAHQHRTPVVGFRAACPGVYGENGAKVVALLAEHVLELEILQFLQCIGVRSVGVGPFRVQLHENVQIVGCGHHGVEGADPGLDAADTFEEGLGGLGIVPEVGSLTFGLFGSYFRALGVYAERLLQHRDALAQVFNLFLCNHHTNLVIIPKFFRY